MQFCNFLTYILSEVSSVSARKLKCPSSARLGSEPSQLGSARAGKFQLGLITRCHDRKRVASFCGPPFQPFPEAQLNYSENFCLLGIIMQNSIHPFELMMLFNLNNNQTKQNREKAQKIKLGKCNCLKGLVILKIT